MSVTIYPVHPLQGGPFPRREVRRPCSTCAQGICQPGWCEDGVEVEHVSTAPELNVANDNARALLATVGLDAGPYLTGEADAMELAGVLEDCEAALRQDADGLVRRAPLLRPEERGRGAKGCRFITAASHDAAAQRRLESLRDVVRWAVDRGCGIAWA